MLEGHTNHVEAIAFHPDGRRLVSGGADKSVKVWDCVSCKCLATYTGHAKAIRCVAVSALGDLAASGDTGGAVKVWDLATGKLRWDIAAHDRHVKSVAFHPKGDLLASASLIDDNIRLWDLKNGKLAKTLRGHKGGVTTVLFHPSGDRLASASKDKAIGLWEHVSGKRLDSLTGHENNLWGLAFHPDGRTLVSASSDSVRMQDLKSGRTERLCGSDEGEPGVMALHPSGALVATGDADIPEGIQLWDTKKKYKVATIAGKSERLFQIAFPPSGKVVASCGKGKAIHLQALPEAALAVIRAVKR
ncbi:MAG: WD40 repeat domain-containing protein [Gemmataceae bacterium]|nr:WD40 repeat domain-containing protein [Gemmataceae bacterium]